MLLDGNPQFMERAESKPAALADDDILLLGRRRLPGACALARPMPGRSRQAVPGAQIADEMRSWIATKAVH